MNVQLNLTLDLETTAGRALFAQLQAALLPVPDRVQLVEPSVPAPGRQAAAARARAAKAAKRMVEEEGYPGSLVPADLNGSQEELDGADEDIGLTDPGKSPAEAKEAGLALIREIYAVDRAAVKELQREFSVAKFYDIDVSRGHEFYQRVMKLARETGLRK